METINFSIVAGYILGLLIIFVVGKILFTPLKFIFKLIFINLLSPLTGIYIGINAVTAVALGILGLPGTCLILLLQIFF